MDGKEVAVLARLRAAIEGPNLWSVEDMKEWENEGGDDDEQ